ncbi:MAG: Rieske 2Fe-2S domain-containing protein [Melioribacter sp.]|uniref:QcrA and Rieske domain-containing protein n=1 Tax=Rosettibacter primus TaxID=3111523 RepID=UPI00247BE9DC|nr:Rieske 2Fe-2S domain-containing protein [Melioribacter sp.]
MKITRKRFLKYLYKILLLPLFVIAYFSNEKVRKLSSGRKIFLPKDLNEGINFFNDIIVHKNRNDIIVLSAKCTHLGCKIDKVELNQLICKCHGSKYSFYGKVLEGPANSDLKKLNIQLDNSSQQYFVYE